MLVIKGSESIGLRLATQETIPSSRFTKDLEFSPSVHPRNPESKGEHRAENSNTLQKKKPKILSCNFLLCLTGPKYISKSEDNLLTPQCDPVAHRTSWCAETPVGAQAFAGGSFTDTPMSMCLKGSYASEPAIVVSKPPPVASLPMKLCCASSADSLESESAITEAPSQTGPALLKMKSFTESSSDLQAALEDPRNSPQPNTTTTPDSIAVPPPGTPTDRVLSVTDTSCSPAPQSRLANDQNITFGRIAALSPLHIDSVVLESDVFCCPPAKADKGSLRAAPISSHNSSMVRESEREVEQVNYSRLVDALDIHSPELFKLGVSSELQSTPYKLDAGLDEDFGMSLKMGTFGSSSALGKTQTCSENGSNDQPLSPRTEKRRVAEHIQHFNKLTLHSPRGSRATQIRSPLKFQRTPVRQTVRRMNSLLGDSRRPTATSGQSSRVGKAVSLESGLSPQPQRQPHPGLAQAELSNSVCPVKKPPPIPPKKPNTLAWKPKPCALGDMTNKVQPKTRADGSVPGAQKAVPQQLLEKDRNHYRGSPRNPLNQARLLSATKPVDL